MRARSAAVLFAFAALASPAHAAICGDRSPNNLCLRADDPQQACASQLSQNPSSLSTRMALCEVLAEAGELDRAQVTIQEGLDRCSGNSATCQTLRLALSNIRELRASRDRADPGAANRARQTARRYCLSPIPNMRSITACEQLLLSAAKDAPLYESLASKLLKQGEPSRAAAYLLRGRKEIGRDDLFSDLLTEANEQRKVIVEDCLSDNSLAKCEQAYLAGAEDEYLVLRRQGELQTAVQDYDQARASLSSASSLRPGDATIKDALEALNVAQNPPTRQPVADLPVTVAQIDARPTTDTPAAADPAPAVAQNDSPEAKPPEVAYRNTISATGTSF